MNRDLRPSINDLPDEVLLIVFRKLSAVDFVTTVPPVCGRWSAIVASDTRTLRRVCMCHANAGAGVTFAYLYDGDHQVDDDDDGPFHRMSDRCGGLCPRDARDERSLGRAAVPYTTAFYLSARHPEVFGSIRALTIACRLDVYAADGFTCADGLTALAFSGVTIRPKDQYTLTELGSVYPNVRDLMYVNDCVLASGVEPRFLHAGFGRLERFRLDHHTAGARLLRDLLTAHPGLRTVVLDRCGTMDDRLIEVLMDGLQGRTVRRLSMHSPYFTDGCVRRFLTTDRLVLRNGPHVNVSRAIVPGPFSVAFD